MRWHCCHETLSGQSVEADRLAAGVAAGGAAAGAGPASRPVARVWKMPRSWNRRIVKRPAEVRVRQMRAWHAWADRQHLAGRTTRGNPFKRRPEARLVLTGIDPTEARLLVADIDALASSINQVFQYLPEMVQWRLRDLENNLARVRVNLVPRNKRAERRPRN